MTRTIYPTVKRGHIVPAVYQRNFAAGQQVAVHFAGQDGCQLRNVKRAGTQGPYYRRVRPDGSTIDDIEASLSVVENAVQPVFASIVAGEPLTIQRKHVLATFFGMQMVRGPGFFSERADGWQRIVAGLSADEFKPAALAEHGGDLNAVRAKC